MRTRSRKHELLLLEGEGEKQGKGKRSKESKESKKTCRWHTLPTELLGAALDFLRVPAVLAFSSTSVELRHRSIHAYSWMVCPPSVRNMNRIPRVFASCLRGLQLHQSIVLPFWGFPNLAILVLNDCVFSRAPDGSRSIEPHSALRSVWFRGIPPPSDVMSGEFESLQSLRTETLPRRGGLGLDDLVPHVFLLPDKAPLLEDVALEANILDVRQLCKFPLLRRLSCRFNVRWETMLPAPDQLPGLLTLICWRGSPVLTPAGAQILSRGFPRLQHLKHYNTSVSCIGFADALTELQTLSIQVQTCWVHNVEAPVDLHLIQEQFFRHPSLQTLTVRACFEKPLLSLHKTKLNAAC